jgi:hypothetical protein
MSLADALKSITISTGATSNVSPSLGKDEESGE